MNTTANIKPPWPLAPFHVGTVTLSFFEDQPDSDGNVEVAVLNLPPFVPPASTFTGTPDPGKHFEMYYDVAETPLTQSARLVPKAGAAPDAPTYSEIDWHAIHPQEALWSNLLNALRMNIGRTMYEQALCPPFVP